MIGRLQLYESHKQDRRRYTDLVLNSTAHKKVVAAGPGTGKTFLFKEVCRNIGDDNILILSFINELVNDLRNELGKVAEVRTLHSFARKQLKKDFYMNLTGVIGEDYSLYHGRAVPFDKIFSRLLQGFGAELDFYSNRRRYYSYFGPYCSIYTLIKIFENNPERIPTYSQVLVDEFQDFNALEMYLIDLLGSRSPLIVVGDDDQSLYSFKFAEPNGIRDRFRSSDYEPFELPYCSRCPKVLVGAANKLIEVAKRKGFLKKRIDKRYIYYCSEDKDVISGFYPKIILRSPVYHRQVASILSSSISTISKHDKNFSVLVICTFPNQIPPLVNALHKKGFTNIETPPDRIDLAKREAYAMLLRDNNSNLAWRVLASYVLNEEKLRDLVKLSIREGKPFQNLFDPAKREEVRMIMRVLKKIKDNREIKSAEAELIFDELNFDPTRITVEKIKNEVLLSNAVRGRNKGVSIKIVTMLGAKGLTRDHVFLVNCDDRFLLDNETVTDGNICQFLVALTRAKRSFSVVCEKAPTFLRWIGPDYYDNML